MDHVETVVLGDIDRVETILLHHSEDIAAEDVKEFVKAVRQLIERDKVLLLIDKSLRECGVIRTTNI